MQLYALDDDLSLIFVGSADRKKDYVCLECQSIVRVRGGMHRQNHFYHIHVDRECRQNGKGMEHIQMQSFIYNLLPKNDCELEKRFQEIGRIADVVWRSEKIIFEIQCSPISADEVRERNQAYQSLGYSVVWILHDKQFNGRRMSAAEHYLESASHYFTNMNKMGQGIVYDQFDVVHQGIRVFKSPCFPIDLRYAVRKNIAFRNIPQRLQKRMKQTELFFQGDLHEHVAKETVFAQALEKEEQLKPTKMPLYHWITKTYRIIFRYFLERATY